MIASIKACLCGEDADGSPEMVTLVVNEVYNQDLLMQLVTHLPKLEFEVSRAWTTRARRVNARRA